jgi:hypothetical protein
VSKLYQGSIVWIPLADHRGHNFYNRPVIILVRTDEITSASELFGVVASNTAYHETPRPHEYIEVPHHPQGLVCTKLKKGTVAICTWLESFKTSDVRPENIGGRVPQQVLEIIVLKIREIFGARRPVMLDSEPDG